jgi:hypothetical protein
MRRESNSQSVHVFAILYVVYSISLQDNYNYHATSDCTRNFRRDSTIRGGFGVALNGGDLQEHGTLCGIAKLQQRGGEDVPYRVGTYE